MKRIFFATLFLLYGCSLFSQIDKEFWFVAPEVSANHGDRPVYMRISTMDDTAHISLRMPANPKFMPILRTVNPNTTTSIQLDIIGGNSTWLDSIENNPPDHVLRKGLYLTSDKNVTAYYEVANISNPAVSSMKGKNALGTEFYISSQDNYPNQTNDGSEAFDIVATEDNTVILITPTIAIVGHAANVTFQVILNKGETYSARTTNITATASLKGSHVVSDKPIAITIFDDSIITGGWDEIADQTIPVNLCGLEYIVIKGFADNTPPGNDDERVYILATKDNTDIMLDGNPVPVATLNATQQYNYPIPAASNTVYVKASKPVYVYHLSGHPGEAGSAILPQDSCTGSRQAGFNRTSSSEFAMLILCRNGIQDNFYLNGSNTLIPGASFSLVPGTGNSWVYYRQNNLSVGTVPVGANVIKNTMGKFHLGILNMGSGGSSEYGYFSDFSSLYLGADKNICPGDSVALDGGQYMASYEWKKLVSGIWTTIDTNRFYTVHDSGYYACIVNGDFCTLRDTIHVALYPIGSVTLGPDRTICQNSTTSFDAGVFLNYLWSTGSTSRWITTGQPGPYWVRVTNNNGCKATDTVMVALDSIPQTTHAITGPVSACQGQNNVVYTIASLPYADSYVWTPPAGATGSSTTNTVSLDFSAIAGNGQLKVHGHNACGDGRDTSFLITVNPTPLLKNNPDKEYICSGNSTSVTLISNVIGTLFTWTASGSGPLVTGFSDNSIPTATLDQTLVNSGPLIESVTYHITPGANGCDGPVSDFIVYVYPVPDMANSPSKVQCNNFLTGITLTSNVPGTLFTWTASGSSPEITGFNNNASPSSTIDDLLVNNGHNTEFVTYQVIPHANGCDGQPVNYVVTVYPTPDLANPVLSRQQCNNLSTGITLGSNVAGTAFTWTATGSSPQLTGYSNNSTPSVIINDLLLNSGYKTDSVTYFIMPRANGCSGQITNYNVSVYPTPDLSNTPKLMQVCNSISTNLALTSDVSGTLFTWTCTPSSANITGWSNNPSNPSALLDQTLVNSGMSVESVTYHMTPHANGCDGPVTDYVVSVVQLPDVYFNPSAETICSGQFTDIQVLSHVPGATFLWTASGSSGLVTGFSAGSGSFIRQPLINSGNSIETVTYNVFPSAYGCPPGVSQIVTVTVNPKPAVTNSQTAFQQCSAAIVTIVPSSSVTGSTFNWTATGSSPLVTGFLPGSGLNIQQTLINSGYNIETVTYSVIPVANGCPGDAVPFVVTVFPVPDVYFSPLSQAVCPLEACNITNNSHVSGALYSWSATGSSLFVTGYSPGAGQKIKQILNNTGNIIETVTYHVSPVANGCPGINADVMVTVYPAPVVSFTACFDPVVTTDAQPVKLRGGLPYNGTYSGKGVTGTTFFPSIAGVDTVTLTYRYANQFGCRDSASQTIAVISPELFTCGNALTDPRNNKTYPTISIGTQCWMAANLDYGSFTSINNMQRDNCISEKYCFNNVPGNCSAMGGLYQWDEMMRYDNVASGQGLCPPAWHVPTEAEWNTLFSFYNSSGFAGSPLKSSGYSGFDAFPNGVFLGNVNWYFPDFATFFWSSTSHGSYKAWAHGLNTYNPSVSFYPSGRSNAFPVRCIRN